MTKSLAAEREFASDASHQLRTPLTALLMRLEEISVSDDVEVVHEEAGIAMEQVERLTRVVDDLLDAQPAQQRRPRPEVSLDSVIAALQREWQPAFEQARRSVRVHGERASWSVDPVALTPGAQHAAGELHWARSRHGGDAGPAQRAVRRRRGQRPGRRRPAAIAPHIFERSVSSGRGSEHRAGPGSGAGPRGVQRGRLDLVRPSRPGSRCSCRRPTAT